MAPMLGPAHRRHLNDGVGILGRQRPSLGVMNLARHAAVLWRFRSVTATGLIIGILLAVLASYKVSFDGGPSLTARGTSTWSSTSSVLVTQPGFPEGRVVLPATPQVTEADGTETVDPNRIEFADPGRFIALADLYSKLATSDQVRARVRGKPAPERITAMPVQGQSGGSTLPMIQIATTAPTAAGAQQLNVDVIKAMRELLETQQGDWKIAEPQRVVLSQVDAPSKPFLVAGPSKTASILALMLCLIGTIAITHLLANIRGAAPKTAPAGGAAIPWTRDDVSAEAPAATANGNATTAAPPAQKHVPAGHWTR